jgi:hypothetical protein
LQHNGPLLLDGDWHIEVRFRQMTWLEKHRRVISYQTSARADSDHLEA